MEHERGAWLAWGGCGTLVLAVAVGIFIQDRAREKYPNLVLIGVSVACFAAAARMVLRDRRAGVPLFPSRKDESAPPADQGAARPDARFAVRDPSNSSRYLLRALMCPRCGPAAPMDALVSKAEESIHVCRSCGAAVHREGRNGEYFWTGG